MVEGFGTSDTFESLKLSAPTLKALHDDFGYKTMSVVQAACIPLALKGLDLVAKAKTGTGKTLAFLVPMAERLLANRRAMPFAPPRAVRSLVISPTRELAQQIETEALQLGKYHSIKAACVVGGLSIQKDLKNLSNGLDLLIGTPGRLKDLIENYPGIQEQVRVCQENGSGKDNAEGPNPCLSFVQLAHIQYLCLDEADRLLDMGFKADLDAIFAKLPGPQMRQTVLFSATFPPDVKEMTDRTLKREHTVVNTIGDDDDQTHKHVVQESVIVPLEYQLHALHELIRQHQAANPQAYKIIVFFTTARMASFVSRLFNQADCPTLELHSRLSQAKRTKITDQFRDGNKLVLFSSDVSARGMDFPGVTLIIQVGLTAQDQYVHRLGRTARAGKEGHGIILLAPFEQRFLTSLSRDLPITPLKLEPNSILDSLSQGRKPNFPASLAKRGYPHPLDYAYTTVSQSTLSSSDEDSLKTEAEAAYRAFIGFYNGNLKTIGFDKARLVEVANEWSQQVGLDEIPAFEPKTVGKMGMKGVPGLRIERVMEGRGGQGGGRGGQQQGQRGGGQQQSRQGGGQPQQQRQGGGQQQRGGGQQQQRQGGGQQQRQGGGGAGGFRSDSFGSGFDRPSRGGFGQRGGYGGNGGRDSYAQGGQGSRDRW